MEFQRLFLRALTSMCKGMLIVSLVLSNSREFYLTYTTIQILLLAQTNRPNWERLRLNFVRRYKWAFTPEYEDAGTVFIQPDFERFPQACAAVLRVS
jgi:N-alpha-acetyltransferase 35, NatC auxiliary subunit